MCACLCQAGGHNTLKTIILSIRLLRLNGWETDKGPRFAEPKLLGEPNRNYENLSPTNETRWANCWKLNGLSWRHSWAGPATSPLPADMFAQRSRAALGKQPACSWIMPGQDFRRQRRGETQVGEVSTALPLLPSASARFDASIFAPTAKQATVFWRLHPKRRHQDDKRGPSAMNAAASFHLVGREKKKLLYYTLEYISIAMSGTPGMFS